MGLLDKVKAQATAATVMAKDAAQKGQAKLDEVQAKKAADGMLRDLGAAFYATKTGRATPSTDAEIESLVAALQSHESEHGALTLAPESAAAAPTATTAAPPTAMPVTAPGTSSPPPPPPATVADPSSPPPPPPTAQTI
ncbi:MAG: hypothetical protein ACLQRH_22040 [Acidimicrobiales bacterium]